jgi:hypothetical protein
MRWIGWTVGLIVAAVLVWLAVRPQPDLEWKVIPGTTVRVGESLYLQVRARRAGYLYLLSDDGAKDTMNALGTFPFAADSVVRIPGGYGFRFDQPGIVEVRCIWSTEAVPELDALSVLFNSRDQGRVASYDQRVRLRQLVASPPKSVRVWSVRLTAR